MKLIWTRSTMLSDKEDVITWAFGHRSSHFAIGFFDEAVMFHSIWDGVGVDDYYDFYSSRVKVYEIDVPTNEDEEAEILKAMIDLYADRAYDYKYFFWLCWIGFKKKILGIKPPMFVESESKDSIICHEVLQLLPDDLRPDIDFGAGIMPETMYLMVKDVWETKNGV